MKSFSRLSNRRAFLLRKYPFSSPIDDESEALPNQADDLSQEDSSRVVIYIEFQGEKNDQHSSSQDDQLLEKIQQIIEENPANEALDIEHLCQVLGLSESQLFRKMKALTGESPMKFFRRINLHRARQLLQCTDLSVSEIAYDLGFSDPNYFSRVFRKEFHQTPSEIRK